MDPNQIKNLPPSQSSVPILELSGNLAAQANTVNGVTLTFTEPPDSHKPDVKWRLHVFKDGEVVSKEEPLYEVHRQSCYLFGREIKVTDIPALHPFCSKQHAVIQFRRPEGSNQARPYLMDLGSTNRSFVNGNAIEPQRYYKLVENNTIRFGNSSREYLILHENSRSTD